MDKPDRPQNAAKQKGTGSEARDESPEKSRRLQLFGENKCKTGALTAAAAEAPEATV